MAATSGSIRVLPVSDRRRLAAFIRVPWQIYADDPNWVPPLKLERRLHFSSLNPYFAHGRWQAWVAYRGNQPVGRVSAQVDELHRRHYSVKSGHFGLLEYENNHDVASALVAKSEGWLLQQQTEVVTGPFNFSINQECGLLVDGFDTPPALMMPHNREWYGELLEQQGYCAVKDLYAYWVKTDFTAPRVMRALVDRYGKSVTLRELNRKKFKQELELIRNIFNDAWSDNWGFTPITQAEFAELGASLRLFVPDDYVYIAEYEGTPVAFIVALPNLNEVLKGLDGRLLPLGIFRLIRALKKQEIKTGRVPLMGVRKVLQNTPLGMALAFLVINCVKEALMARGVEAVEMSWILEDNLGMRSILERIGSSLYKTYRIYQKYL